MSELVNLDNVRFAYGTDGNLYEFNDETKTCKRVFTGISIDDFDMPQEMDLKEYARYLRERFGEDAPIKKNKLWFRGYRIYCDLDCGFTIEDSYKRYAKVETEFDGIPSPKELGDWFDRPKREMTSEEVTEAAERGKKLKEDFRREIESKAKPVEEEIDLEKKRKELLKHLAKVTKESFNGKEIVAMLPYKKWQRKARKLIKDFTEKKIRFPKLVAQLTEITKTESFEVVEKKTRNTFTGTLLPDFEVVGMLEDDMIEVDGDWIAAVPFLVDYLLHYEPRCMQQLMRFAAGEIGVQELLTKPFYTDGSIEYGENALPNTAENARIVSAMYDSIGLIAPQDMLFTADLEVGDVILIMIDDQWKKRTIMSTDEGVCISKGIGITKYDKWVKIESKQ